MSYIRCLSNPEGLYIWESFNGLIISQSCDNEFKMPVSIFNNMIRLYVKDCGCNENYSYKGCKLVYKPVAPFKDTPMGKLGVFKWVLTYKKHRLELWDCTWSHIVLNNMTRICTKKQISAFVRLHLCKK